jgi:hypothetical protein
MKTFILTYTVNDDPRTEIVYGDHKGNVWATKTAHVRELEDAGFTVKYIDIDEII